MGACVCDHDEVFKLKTLRQLCRDLGDVTELRVQAERLTAPEHSTFLKLAAEAGFQVAKPLFYTQTLKYDLKSATELLPEMSAKLRAKLKAPKNGFQIKVLTDTRHIDSCREALKASFSRTQGTANDFDFEAFFEATKRAPQEVRIVGIAHENNPDEILAFTVATVSGTSAEFVAAGSKADPNLRKIPFNYLLFWELMQWAHTCGASWIDMGGVTPANEGDPLAGISQFKRHFTKNEIEICREFTTTLKPVSAWFFNRAQAARQIFLDSLS